MKRIPWRAQESVFADVTIAKQAKVGWPWPVQTDAPIQDFAHAGVEDPLYEAGLRDHHYNVVAALVISETLKRALGDDPKQVGRALRAADINVSDAQVTNYFTGRFRPSRMVVNLTSARLDMPELRMVAEWPWVLLTARPLCLIEIEHICAAGLDPLSHGSDERSSPNSAQDFPSWYTAKRFEPLTVEMCAPGAPAEFWQRLARLRVAMAQKDMHSVNAHLAEAIQWLPSLAAYPAVRPHTEELFACLRMLMRTLDPMFLWFSVDWDAADYRIRTGTYGADPDPISFSGAQLAWLRRHHRGGSTPGKVFSSIFTGNRPSAFRDQRIAHSITWNVIRGRPP